MEYRVAPLLLCEVARYVARANLFGGGLAGKACLSRLGEGRSGICFAKTTKILDETEGTVIIGITWEIVVWEVRK